MEPPPGLWRNVALAHAGADTDDTNRGPGDTRTIRWVVKMARSKTFPMSVHRPLERRLHTVAGAIDFLLTDGSRNHGHAP
jgi:hypothetical protein